MNKTDLTLIELTEENIESMIYEIRGQKVMLDFDLARIYGYDTKYLNRQVQRNSEKFDEDFMFQLTKEEFGRILKCQNVTSSLRDNLMWKKSTSSSDNILMSKKLTSSWGGTRKLPYAFTEQGIYMLMTVLKGELAVKQSKTIIRLFKQMKDYIISHDSDELLGLSKQVYENKQAIVKLEKDSSDINKQLKIVMENFIDKSTYKHFLILNGQKIEADIAYQSIYSLAKYSIIIIDDYISIKTLRQLKVCKPNIDIKIFSDNVAVDKVSDTDLLDFNNDTGRNLVIYPTNNKIHDRYIVIDYKKDNERLFDSGASSKDAGHKIMTILEIGDKEAYYGLIDNLLNNGKIL